MDRRNPQSSLNRRSVYPRWISAFQLLLRTNTSKCRRSDFDETSRRDLYCQALSRIAIYYRDIAKRRPQYQPETDPGHHERIGIGRKSARPQYVQKSSRTLKVSISTERSTHHQAIAGLEYGYHVHTPARRFCIPRGGYGLVQSFGACKPPLKLFGGQLLRRGIRRGCRSVRSPGDFQYRSGRSIFIAGICECGTQQGNKVQHGWAWASFGQYFCRAPMEVCEVRRGIFA